MRGKHNKQRSLPVVAGAATALADWLATRGDAPGPLFWGVGNRNRDRRLTTQAVYKMLRKRARAAGIQRLSPHDFRRTSVGDLLDAGADIVTVQKLAGHTDVTPTAHHDWRGEQARRKAVDLLHVPYRPWVLRGLLAIAQAPSQFSTTIAKSAKSAVLAVTNTRSWTAAMDAIWPSANEGVLPAAANLARWVACQDAACWS